MSSVSGGVVVVSAEEFGEAMGDGSAGFCLACGAESTGTEPDAERYRCYHCGEHRVYGAEQLLIMGRLRVEASEGGSDEC